MDDVYVAQIKPFQYVLASRVSGKKKMALHHIDINDNFDAIT
jgi:hypothetical protein